MRGWAVVLVLVGCSGGPGANGRNGSQGSVGVTGPTGATGPTGPVGAPGGGMRWVAADGTVVTPSTELLHVDADGYLWPIDPETGEVDTLKGFEREAWSEPDCAGTEYADNLALPRFAMVWGRYGEPVTYYVRSDTAVITPTPTQSHMNAAGDCIDDEILEAAVPMSELVQVDPPAPWAGPLHLELVQ